METKLIVPNQIRVGYQKRGDTYENKLGFITFEDKGKLRKEASWNNWRDKNIKPDTFDNVPTEGFVLNKDVGGQRWSSWSWHNREMKIRVYDPRGFEIEITVNNLLYILSYNGALPGKGLEGEYIYGWDGKELVLIPCKSPDYNDIKEFNEYRNNDFKLTSKDLVAGTIYLNDKKEEFLYVGSYYQYTYPTGYNEDKKTKEVSLNCKKKNKVHVFATYYAHSYVLFSKKTSLTMFKGISDKKVDSNVLEKIYKELYKNDEYYPFILCDKIQLDKQENLEHLIRHMWTNIQKNRNHFKENMLLTDTNGKAKHILCIEKTFHAQRVDYKVRVYNVIHNPEGDSRDSIIDSSNPVGDYLIKEERINRYDYYSSNTFLGIDFILEKLKETNILEVTKDSYYAKFKRDNSVFDTKYKNNEEVLPLNFYARIY